MPAIEHLPITIEKGKKWDKIILDSRGGVVQPSSFTEGKPEAQGEEETCPRSLRQNNSDGVRTQLTRVLSRVLSCVQTHLLHLSGQAPPDKASGTGCGQPRLIPWAGLVDRRIPNPPPFPAQSEEESVEAGVAKVRTMRLLGHGLGAVRWQKKALLSLGQRLGPVMTTSHHWGLGEDL